MTPLEKLINLANEMINVSSWRICLGTTAHKDAPTFNELRAYAKELKEQRGTCRQCENAAAYKDYNYFYCDKWQNRFYSVDGLGCGFFQSKKKKVRKAQWLVSIKTPGFFTPAEAKERFGDRVLKPVEESWKEVEE